jgi:hypothetical protein
MFFFLYLRKRYDLAGLIFFFNNFGNESSGTQQGQDYYFQVVTGNDVTVTNFLCLCNSKV